MILVFRTFCPEECKFNSRRPPASPNPARLLRASANPDLAVALESAPLSQMITHRSGYCHSGPVIEFPTVLRADYTAIHHKPLSERNGLVRAKTVGGEHSPLLVAHHDDSLPAYIHTDDIVLGEITRRAHFNPICSAHFRLPGQSNSAGLG